MAYTNTNQQSQTKPSFRNPTTGATKSGFGNNHKSTQAKSGNTSKAQYIGLFSPKVEGDTLASIQVKEDIVIKAGTYINLYTRNARQDDVADKTYPAFLLGLKEGVLKSQAN